MCWWNLILRHWPKTRNKIYSPSKPIVLFRWHHIMIVIWVKYGHFILPSTISLNAMENFQTHRTYRNALWQLLCTDLDGNLSTSLNPPTKAKLNEYLSTFFKNAQNYETRQYLWQIYGETRIKKIVHPWSKGDCIICNNNSSLLIHQFIHQEVSKAWVFGVNTWTDATGLYQDEDWTWLFLPFSWRSIYLFFKMHPLS